MTTNVPWSYSQQVGKPGHCMVAQVWDVNGKSLVCMEATEDEIDATQMARMMSVAPELLAACRKALYAIKGREHTGFLEDVIAKATGGRD